ncbi:hypothetical protein JYU34_009511 [Plutella xylostella]|uniref:Proton channel OtopLc-like n=1 Tax=Plutella xylostella TaxID=51655 RepID=A0ABQ7QJS2_PLUXY|nr:hypothetical protein JYU34_009511 [Plutella xylostella]
MKNKDKCNQNGKDWRERSELVSVPEDESELVPHALPRLSIVPPCSTSSSVDALTTKCVKPSLSHGDESMTVLLSAFYAKLLIVLGIALPVTSTIQNELYTNLSSDIFTMYLYIVSMTFLAYTFYHLRISSKPKNQNLKRTRYGSFYLHMGVAGFSVGSIIYSCLQVGGYFDLRGDCRLLVVALKPALRILFTVAQTVFIFSYTDILDPMRGIVLHRFGLMHLIATNVCEWLNVVVQETRDDIITVAYDRPAMQRYANITGPPKITYETNYTLDDLSQNATQNITDLLANLSASETWSCNVTDMIAPLIRSANPYLRPCGVEYSLLCSVIIAVIWNDICTVPGTKAYKSQLAANTMLETQNKSYSKFKASNHYSVDCGSAHKGLFMGVAVLAGTIVSLMLFNGLFHNKKHVELALLQINIWETILFLLMAAGSAACIRRMRTLRLRRAVPALPLEHALLLVTQCGVYLYYLFQIIGAGFLIHRYPEARRATRIISPLCAVVQSSFQTLLVLDAWSRRCGGASRPGRQLVTFLLVGNFALWLLNRVKNSRAEFHPLQMEFYGVWAWTLITHVSVPLLVCYRFQATVCFYEIWKNSYKQNKDTRNELDFDDIELKNHVA